MDSMSNSSASSAQSYVSYLLAYLANFIAGHPYSVLTGLVFWLIVPRLRGPWAFVARFLGFYFAGLMDQVFQRCRTHIAALPGVSTFVRTYSYIVAFFASLLCVLDLINYLAATARDVLIPPWRWLRHYFLVGVTVCRVFLTGITRTTYLYIVAFTVGVCALIWYRNSEPVEVVQEEAGAPADKPRRLTYQIAANLKWIRNFVCVLCALAGFYEFVVELWRTFGTFSFIATAGGKLADSVSRPPEVPSASPLSSTFVPASHPGLGSGSTLNLPQTSSQAALATEAEEAAAALAEAAAAMESMGLPIAEMSRMARLSNSITTLTDRLWSFTKYVWYLPVFAVCLGLIYLVKVMHDRIKVLEEKEKTRYANAIVAYEARVLVTPPPTSPIAVTSPLPVVTNSVTIDSIAEAKNKQIQPVENPQRVSTPPAIDSPVIDERVPNPRPKITVDSPVVVPVETPEMGLPLEESAKEKEEVTPSVSTTVLPPPIRKPKQLVAISESKPAPIICSYPVQALPLPVREKWIAKPSTSNCIPWVSIREKFTTQAVSDMDFYLHNNADIDELAISAIVSNLAHLHTGLGCEIAHADAQGVYDILIQEAGKRRGRRGHGHFPPSNDVGDDGGLREREQEEDERRRREQADRDEDDGQSVDIGTGIDSRPPRGQRGPRQPKADPAHGPVNVPNKNSDRPRKGTKDEARRPDYAKMLNVPVGVKVHLPTTAKEDAPSKEEAAILAQEFRRAACEAAAENRKEHKLNRLANWWMVSDRCTVCSPLTEDEKKLAKPPIKGRTYVRAKPHIAVESSIVNEAKTAQPKFVIPTKSIFEISTEKKVGTGFFTQNQIVTAFHVPSEQGVLIPARMEWPPHSKVFYDIPEDSWTRETFNGIPIDVAVAPLPKALMILIGKKEYQDKPRWLAPMQPSEWEKYLAEKGDAIIVGFKDNVRDMLTVSTGRLVAEIDRSTLKVMYDPSTDFGDSGAPIFTTDGRYIGVHCGGVRGERVNAFTLWAPPKN